MGTTATGAQTATARGRAARAIVGRDDELHELDGILDEVLEGRGLVAMLSGEPGIGKTTLARAFADRAGDRATVLWGSCGAEDTAPAYWPWTQALRRLSTTLGQEQTMALADVHAPQLGRLLPQVARAAGAPAGAADPFEGDAGRFSLFEAVAAFFEAASAQRPLVVVLDDLHDADAPSVALLAFLARAVALAPVLVLGTFREHEAALRDDLPVPLTRVGPDARHLPLHLFTREEVAALLRARGAPSSPTLAGALHRRTNGNPFFVDELLALTQPESESDRAPGDQPEVPELLPAGVRDAIRRRLDPVTPRARELLAIGAVIGVRFPAATVAAADGTTVTAVLEALEGARRRGLIEEAPGPTGSVFAFPHALVAETIYADLPVARRVELHRAVAEALERGAAADPPLDELAHHYARAVPAAPAAKAYQYARAAGEHAMALAAWETAARRLADAVELEASLEGDDARRCDTLLALGRARNRAGDVDAARSTLLDAAALARRIGAGGSFALAAVELGAVGLPPGAVDDEIVGLLTEALALLDQRPTALRARVLARLAVQLYWSPDRARGLELVEEARVIAEGLEPAATLDVLAQLHLATSGPERPERIAELDRLLDLAVELGEAETELQVRVWRVAALTQLGDLAAAAAEIEAFALRSTRLGQPRWTWYVPQLRAVRALAEGRLEEAEQLRQEAGETGLQVHGSMAPLLLGGHLFAVRWLERRLGDLVDPVTQLADLHPTMPVWRCVRIAALADAGRHDEARAELGRLVSGGAVHVPDDTTWLVSAAVLADSAARLGAADEAAVLYDALLPYAEHHATLPSACYLAPVRRFLGVAALAAGDARRALEHLDPVLQVAARERLRATTAMAGLDRARALRALGEEGRAVAALEEAQRCAQATGLGALEAEIVQERRRAPAVAPTPPATPAAIAAPAPGPVEGLLLREGDTWSLQALGRRVTLRHAKGVTHLAVLLARPGVDVHALELVAVGGEPASPATLGGPGELSVRRGESDVGPLLDREAKAAYRQRIEELREDLEEAERFHDPERASRAREELDALAHELTRAVGLGGRDRRPGSAAERARVNVTRAIRSTVRRVAEHDPVLGAELEATVRTGTTCRFDPDPRRPVRWTVEVR